MARFDLSVAEWAILAPLLPNKPRGVARVDVLLSAVETIGRARCDIA